MVSLIYILSTRVVLCFAVHKLSKFLSNPGNVHFEGLVHLLRYIRDKNNLGLRYYSKIEDEPLSDLLLQANINTESKLMVFYDSRWQEYPYTGISTGAYIIFYRCEPIDNFTHVPGPVAQYISESEYNSSCTAGMALAHFSMINNELLNKDPDVVLEQVPLIILDSKSAIYMAKNGKGTKHIRHISIRMHFVRNGKEYNVHKTLWYEGVM